MATSLVHSKEEDGGTYTYSSQPRTVPQRKKFRDPSLYGNIMYDRRIVRGNTYALNTLPATSQPDPLELQRQQETRRRALARKRAHERMQPLSPEPVDGRKHVDVQTELYLEEITDRVEEAEAATQTDAFLDRPPTPHFVPAKTGMDVATQIEEGDLFDFDLEVRPIFEVLVGKTVEQALLEVMEEEELASLRAQQREFEENRNAELVETQRLEEQERRRREEKERRMHQQREALLKEKETAEKIAARAFAQSYLADLVPSVFSTLSEGGFFYDPVEREVEMVFMPWLMDETAKALDKKFLARALLDSIIRDVVMKKLGISPPEPTPMPTPPLEPQPQPSSEPLAPGDEQLPVEAEQQPVEESRTEPEGVSPKHQGEQEQQQQQQDVVGDGEADKKEDGEADKKEGGEESATSEEVATEPSIHEQSDSKAEGDKEAEEGEKTDGGEGKQEEPSAEAPPTDAGAKEQEGDTDEQT